MNVVILNLTKGDWISKEINHNIAISKLHRTIRKNKQARKRNSKLCYCFAKPSVRRFYGTQQQSSIASKKDKLSSELPFISDCTINAIFSAQFCFQTRFMCCLMSVINWHTVEEKQRHRANHLKMVIIKMKIETLLSVSTFLRKDVSGFVFSDRSTTRAALHYNYKTI